MAITIRKATPEDAESIATLLKYCYDYPIPALESIKQKFDQLYDEHFVAEREGTIIAALRNLPLTQHIRGKDLAMSGIANVVSAPENRRQGIVNQMMEFMFKYMKDHGQVVSTLYPFKDTFYHKQGYINASPFKFMQVNPVWFQKWNTCPEGYQLERIKASDGYPLLKQVQEQVVTQFQGGVKRSDQRWKELYGGKGSWIVVAKNPHGTIEGAMHLNVSGFGYKLFGENNIGTFSRIEFFTTSLAAKHALFHFIYLNSDQIHRVMMPIYPHEQNLFSWLAGFTKVKIHTHMVNMVRVIDAKLMLNDLPLPKSSIKSSIQQLDQELFIQLHDSWCEWNNCCLHVWKDEEKLKCGLYKAEEASSSINLTIEGLSALVYGTMTAEECVYFKWIQNCNNDQLQLLNSWFPRVEYCNTEFF